MKKMISLLLALCMLFALAACGAESGTEAPVQDTPAPAAEKEWTRAGYFQDESGNMISVTWMDDVVDPGWYVGVMIGETMAGCTLEPENGTLHGDLNAWDTSAAPFVVTVSEEGEDGLLLTVEGGESYHFAPLVMPEAAISVTVNTEGWGYIAWAEGEQTPETDPDYPYQTAYINLEAAAACTFLAYPQAGNTFVKWTKNGEDFSTDAQITLLLDEDANYVAVFEEDPSWQNPVMNFIGDYQCGRASAHVECFGFEDAWITIDWAGSAWETAHWDIEGRLDLDTLTIDYSRSTKQILVYNELGAIKSDEIVYDDGTGTITFHNDGTFTWHDDQSEYGEDMLFEWAPSSGG